jgi:hypothetical protein
MMFNTPDWKGFLNSDQIGRLAGAGYEDLVALIFKELGDNALDTTGDCRYDWIHDPDNKIIGGFVEDDGPGIPGKTPKQIADFFSVSRPLRSSKKIREPTRGALGNGLRVVTGAVYVLKGHLVVETAGYRMKIALDERDGIARPEGIQVSQRKGTRIEFYMNGIGYRHQTRWIEQALVMATGSSYYKGTSSPFWYDTDSFFDLSTSAPKDTTVRQFIETFDGCTGKRAGEIAEPFKDGATYRLIRDLKKSETEQLLKRARAAAVPVKHQRLGLVGADVFGDNGFYYAKNEGTFTPSLIDNHAEIPFVVEVWAYVTTVNPTAALYINRTPVCQSLSIGWRSEGNKTEDKYLTLAGLGISDDEYLFTIPGIKKPISVNINIITPYIPITSTGKSPDLYLLTSVISQTIETAARKAIKAKSREDTDCKKKDRIIDFIFEYIPEAAEHTGGGMYFGQRNLFYTLRKMWENTGDKRELQWGTFQQYVTDYELENGAIPLMTRDNRGAIYHPHDGTEIPLGTLSVDHYTRPEWIFNKMLFVEKEGFFEAMKQAHWPETNDCVLISSKGNATRAAKDVIDLIAETGEPVTVYAVHDADAYGTVIYEKLQEATKARPARKIEIVNIGLEPWTAVIMGLSPEKTAIKEKTAPVADYVREYDRDHGTHWVKWLQSYRIEINQFTTPQFIQYVDDQIAKYGDPGKVIPPDVVIQTKLDSYIEELIHEKALEHLQAEIEAKEAELKARIVGVDIKTVRDFVVEHLEEVPTDSWKDAVVEYVSDELQEREGPR